MLTLRYLSLSQWKWSRRCPFFFVPYISSAHGHTHSSGPQYLSHPSTYKYSLVLLKKKRKRESSDHEASCHCNSEKAL